MLGSEEVTDNKLLAVGKCPSGIHKNGKACLSRTSQSILGDGGLQSSPSLGELAQLETPIARYKPGQKEKSGNSCCFQHIDHLFLGHHHHITGTPSQNDQGTIKT